MLLKYTSGFLHTSTVYFFNILNNLCEIDSIRKEQQLLCFRISSKYTLQLTSITEHIENFHSQFKRRAQETLLSFYSWFLIL